MNAIVDTGSHPVVRSKARAFVRVARQVPAPPVEEDLEKLRAEAIRAVNDYVYGRIVSATDEDELADAIDELIEDATLLRLRSRLDSLLASSVGAVMESPSLPTPTFLFRLVGEDEALKEMILLGHRLTNAYIVACLQRLAHSAKQKRPDDSEDPVPPREGLWWLTDPRLPVPWKRAWLWLEKSDVALEALMSLTALAEPPRWMVETLLGMWVRGAHAYLVFLAGFEGVDPPDPSLVKPDEIQPAVTALSLHRAAELGYQERLKAARAAGGWYPTPEHEPEDAT